jgi:hypothetical protein
MMAAGAVALILSNFYLHLKDVIMYMRFKKQTINRVSAKTEIRTKAGSCSAGSKRRELRWKF